MSETPALSIVIPAYNEERRIGSTLVSVAEYCDRAAEPYEVIVVDDGSRDRTAELVATAARRHPAIRLLALAANAGKGAAVRAGVLASRGREVLFSDADLSTPIHELPRLRAALGQGFDVAIGSRALEGATRRQPLFRRLQGRAFHAIVRTLGFAAVTAIRDTQCGFKLFRGDLGRALFAELSLGGFAFDVELLELAHRHARIAEVPVAWTHMAGSKVRPGIDALKMLADLVRVRLAWRRKGGIRFALPASIAAS